MKQKSLKLNILMNMVLTMSSFIFPLITFPYVSRVLLPIGTGKVSFAASFISYFSMFAQLGIPTYGIRTCAKVRDNKEELTRTVHELLTINLVTTTLSYIALTIFLATIPRLQNDKTLYIIVSISIILTTLGMEWLYKALEQYVYITVRSVVFKIIALIAMFILIHEQSDYMIYGGISIFASSASNIFNLINAHKYIDFKPLGGYNFKRHLKPIFVFFAMSCATIIYTNLDTVMLGFMKSDVDVGYYNAAVKIKCILVSIVTSLGAVLLPRSSYYVENGKMDKFWQIMKKALSFVLIVAIPMMIYFILFAKEGIYFLSGEAYIGSILPMQIVMPTLLLIGLSNLLGIQTLVPLGKERILLYAEIVGAFANIILNAILIPHFASSGAAIGTLIAELIVTTMCILSLKNEFWNAIKEINCINILFAVIFATASSFWIKSLRLNVLITLIFSSFLFFGTYIIYLVFRKDTIIFDIYNGITNKLKK